MTAKIIDFKKAKKKNDDEAMARKMYMEVFGCEPTKAEVDLILMDYHEAQEMIGNIFKGFTVNEGEVDIQISDCVTAIKHDIEAFKKSKIIPESLEYVVKSRKKDDTNYIDIIVNDINTPLYSSEYIRYRRLHSTCDDFEGETFSEAGAIFLGFLDGAHAAYSKFGSNTLYYGGVVVSQDILNRELNGNKNNVSK
jgi:hypothetical protein